MNNEKRIIILKWIYFIMICVSPFMFVFTLLFNWSIWFLVIYLGVVILFYLTIHILRALTYVYICPICKNEFKIHFIKDITAYNAKTGAKVLVCPKCGTKEVMHSKVKNK